MNPGSNPFAVPGPLPTRSGGASHHLAPGGPDTVTGTTQTSPDLKSITDELPFALVVFNAAQEVIHENRTCSELAGIGIGEAGGIETWLSSLCPDEEHRESVLRSWRKHVWANQVTRVFSLRLKNNKLRELEFRSTLRDDGGISVVIEDVTVRVRAETNRQHSKQKFRALFSETENGTVLADRTGRIIDANPAFIELVEISLPELRRSTLAGLLHPRDAEELENAARELDAEESTGPIRKTVFLRSRSGEKEITVRYCPVGGTGGGPSMAIYVFESSGSRNEQILREKIGVVSKKAAALLNAVPDLIFLINKDLTVADFAPPPIPWKELETPDSWRNAPVLEIWPLLGELLIQSQKEILDQGRTVRARLAGTREAETDSRDYEFEIFASSGGDGQMLVIVRNHSAAVPSGRILSAEPDTPLREEIGQHSFRNQLQLVTSLFSLEPQGAAARDSFLRWQIRLRALAQAIPQGQAEDVGLVSMMRALSDEVCSLTNAGPSRRAVVVSGSDRFRANASDASLIALLAGELMRLVLATRQQGRGPDIIFELKSRSPGMLDLQVRAGEDRRFLSPDEESEIETLEILASQLRGQMTVPSGNQPNEWQLTAPVLST